MSNKVGIYLCFPIFFSIASGTLIKPNRHRYIIALSELGLNNTNLISLLIQHPCDIVNMFENKNQNLFEKYLDLLPYYDLFSDSAAVASSLSKADDILAKNKKLGIKTTYLL